MPLHCPVCGDERGAGTTRCWGTCFLRERAERLRRKELERRQRVQALHAHPGYGAFLERHHWYSQWQRGVCSLAALLCLPSVNELVESGHAEAVSRLEVSWLGLRPEVVITFERTGSSALATVITLSMPIRESARPGRLLEAPALPSLGRDFWVRTATTTTKAIDPEVVDEVMRASTVAPDCQTPNLLDGTTFRHWSADDGFTSDATWFSPSEKHRMQLHILRLYELPTDLRSS